MIVSANSLATPDGLEVAWTIPLSDDPTDFDMTPDGYTAVISSVSGCSLTFIDLANRRLFPSLRTTGEIGLVRFQPLHDAARAESDSRQLIAAR